MTLFVLLVVSCGKSVLYPDFAGHVASQPEQQISQPEQESSQQDPQLSQTESSQAEQSDADVSAEESAQPPEESVQPPEESKPEPKPEPEPEPQPEQSSIACPSVNGALHVEGSRLVDRTGKPVQLRGVSSHGLAWFPEYINLACFRQLRQEWNVNVVRLAMYTAESGGYCTGGDQNALKALVDQGVRYAAEADMYVVIDWHILSDNNPNMHRNEALAFFRDMSARYAGMDHVIYEICNEPNGGTTWKDIKTYAVDIIGEIRKNDPDAVILVGTPNWSQFVDQAAADPIREYDNLMYTLHFYAATHKEDLRSRMKAAVDNGLPVFVSEYGICDASGNGAIDIGQANAWADLLDQYGISYIAWNLSNKNESSSLLRSTCSKTSGFTANDLSESGRWLYERLTGKAPAGPSQGNTGNTEKPGDPPQNPPGTETFTTDTLEITMTMVNTWNANDGAYRQYTLTLKNISGTALDGWAVTLPFQEAFAVSDSWNGVFSVQGRELLITPMDYNRTVPAGGTVTDIGFILRFA